MSQDADHKPQQKLQEGSEKLIHCIYFNLCEADLPTRHLRKIKLERLQALWVII